MTHVGHCTPKAALPNPALGGALGSGLQGRSLEPHRCPLSVDAASAGETGPLGRRTRCGGWSR
jgi:hypothetical protein